MKRVACLAAAFAADLLAPVAHAQYTGDYQTNTIDAVASNWSVGNGYYLVGSNNVFDVLRVINGGQLTSTLGYLGWEPAAGNNTVVISGSGSLWTNIYDVQVGHQSFGNQLMINNGGRVQSAGGFVGGLSGASGNGAVVSGSNSRWNSTSDFYVGYSGSDNRLTITNGGQAAGINVWVGVLAGASNNTVRIESGGVLDANGLIANNAVGSANNSITNFGGIFQFSTNTPTITPNVARGGSIVLTNGTIAFRDLDTADVKAHWSSSDLTNITFQGNNTFRLNAASNTTSGQDYTFDTGRGATNYVGLEMINGATAWRGGSLTIGANGTLLASNTTASIANVFTNSGTVRVVNGQVTCGGPVVISGGYISDSSTNIYTTNVTLTASGALSGSNGDHFVFYGDVINQSTNRTQFDLSRSTALFTNTVTVVVVLTNMVGTNHTLNLTSSAAVDMGANWTNVGQLATNFSIGTLSIALSNNLTVMGAKLTNALYVGWLDLSAWTTNAGALSTTLSNALTLADINLYYDAGDARNAYLQDASYALWGSGGLLIPIPEPSTAGLILGDALFLAWFLRRKDGRK